jgi:hypothetical protein
MQIQRFNPTDDDVHEFCDDVHEFCDDEYEAGYGARLAGIEWSMCATRSWRAGWADADMGMHADDPELASHGARGF